MPNSSRVRAPWRHRQFAEDKLKGIDAAVGRQVRFRRILLGLSQEAVAKAMGLTFQQLQKYEHGTNRISASRLFQLAMILHAPVAYFFETAEPLTGIDDGTVASGTEDITGNLMKKRKTVELIRAFYAIGGERQQKAALTLIKTLGSSGDD